MRSRDSVIFGWVKKYPNSSASFLDILKVSSLILIICSVILITTSPKEIKLLSLSFSLMRLDNARIRANNSSVANGFRSEERRVGKEC